MLLCSPLYVFAQPAGTDVSGAPRAVVVDQSGGTYLPASVTNSQSLGQTGGSYGISAGAAADNFSTCIAGSALTSAVKNAISNIAGSAVDIIRVPVNNPVQEAKDTGSIITAGISWDQMGWCMVNSLISTIGDATVAWINSGFQGNPAFVEDPGQFFADVADIQAGAFLNEISSGLLCTPLKDLVRINIASSYNSSINYNQQCTFTQGLEQFMAGESFSWTDWVNYTQNPYNNPYGATIYSQIQLDQRIASALGVQSTILDWGVGFLSKKDPVTGKITSPGSVIEKQVNERLFSGQRRLEIADEFDEVVNALVDQLIKIAITEMTGA